MGTTTTWNEDTSAREIADFLPPKPNERWLDLVFRLLVVALLCGWFFMPKPAADASPATPQATAR